MNFDEYQCVAETFAVFTDEFYPIASLMVESAELADLFVKPMLRGDEKEVQREQVVSEAADVLWNLAVMLKRQNIHFSEVAQYSVEKLTRRKKNGTIKGDGDR